MTCQPHKPPGQRTPSPRLTGAQVPRARAQPPCRAGRGAPQRHRPLRVVPTLAASGPGRATERARPGIPVQNKKEGRMAKDEDESKHTGTQNQLGGGIGNRRGSVGEVRHVEANPDGNRKERRMAKKIQRKKGK